MQIVYYLYQHIALWWRWLVGDSRGSELSTVTRSDGFEPSVVSTRLLVYQTPHCPPCLGCTNLCIVLWWRWLVSDSRVSGLSSLMHFGGLAPFDVGARLLRYQYNAVHQT